jgi:hypothetical protein
VPREQRRRLSICLAYGPGGERLVQGDRAGHGVPPVAGWLGGAKQGPTPASSWRTHASASRRPASSRHQTPARPTQDLSSPCMHPRGFPGVAFAECNARAPRPRAARILRAHPLLTIDPACARPRRCPRRTRRRPGEQRRLHRAWLSPTWPIRGPAPGSTPERAAAGQLGLLRPVVPMPPGGSPTTCAR